MCHRRRLWITAAAVAGGCGILFCTTSFVTDEVITISDGATGGCMMKGNGSQ